MFPAACQAVSHASRGGCLFLTFLDVLCEKLARKDVMERDDNLLEFWGWFPLKELFLDHIEDFFWKDQVGLPLG